MLENFRVWDKINNKNFNEFFIFYETHNIYLKIFHRWFSSLFTIFSQNETQLTFLLNFFTAARSESARIATEGERIFTSRSLQCSQQTKIFLCFSTHEKWTQKKKNNSQKHKKRRRRREKWNSFTFSQFSLSHIAFECSEGSWMLRWFIEKQLFFHEWTAKFCESPLTFGNCLQFWNSHFWKYFLTLMKCLKKFLRGIFAKNIQKIQYFTRSRTHKLLDRN